MPIAQAQWVPLGGAICIGLLIGLERERRKRLGPPRIAAGIRTFTLVAILGAASALTGGETLLVAGAGSIALLAAVAYFRSAAEDPGVTTGVALVLCFVLGALSTHDTPMAVALAVVVAVLLASRTPMHDFVQRMVTQREMNDALILATATLVVLPLIPDRYVGPFAAFNPRVAWIIVILMMSVAAAGQLAQRLLGSGLGLAAAGFASGFISGIATIGAMGALMRQSPALRRPAVAGAVLSSVATLVQMSVVLAATSPATLRALAPSLAAAGLLAAAYGAFFTLRTMHAPEGESPPAQRAFNLWQALWLSVFISAAMMIAAALQTWFGDTGLWVGAALAGLADTHAIAVSLASLVAGGRLSAEDAALPILCALTSNACTKAVVAWWSGTRRFAIEITAGLMLVMAGAWAFHFLPGRLA